jgi:hypothetical protein
MTQDNNNRMVLLLIAGIPATMILAATWLWFYVANGQVDLVGALGTANSGELVQPPRQVDDIKLLDDLNSPYSYRDFEPRWTFAVPLAGDSCARQCEHNLYITRQIHVALGKDFNRIRRVHFGETALADIKLTVQTLSDDGPAPADFATLLGNEHRGTKFLRLAPGGYQALFGEQSAALDTWYLIDPAGWVMMSYNDGVPYKDVISDLKFLLKNSGG